MSEIAYYNPMHKPELQIRNTAMVDPLQSHKICIHSVKHRHIWEFFGVQVPAYFEDNEDKSSAIIAVCRKTYHYNYS
jgi:hypothetical protein